MPEAHMTPMTAQRLGELVLRIDTEVDAKDSGRVAAQTAKQVVLQRLREAEREVVFDEYEGREGDIVVRGTGVSRRHAELDVSPDGWVVRDLGSRNGTLLRGVPVAGEVRVAGPTKIGLGDHVVLTIEPTGGGVRVEPDARRPLIARPGLVGPR